MHEAAIELVKVVELIQSVLKFISVTLENPGTSGPGHCDSDARPEGRGLVGHECIESWTQGWSKFIVVAYCAYGGITRKFTAIWCNFAILSGRYGFNHFPRCKGPGQCAAFCGGTHCPFTSLDIDDRVTRGSDL